MSQCTFWRSVLSDPFLRKTTRIRSRCCLNAPFGARRFLSLKTTILLIRRTDVSMHLLALGAF